MAVTAGSDPPAGAAVPLAPTPGGPPVAVGTRARPLASAAGFVGLLLAYSAAVWLGRELRLAGSSNSVLWPAAAVGVLWVASAWGDRRRTAVILAAIGGTVVVVDRRTGLGLQAAAVAAVANGLQAVLTCAVLSRLRPVSRRLRRPGDMAALAVACAAGAGASALIGATVLWLAVGVDLPTTAARWALNVFSSAFVLCAAVLSVPAGRLPRPTYAPRQVTELLALAAALVAGYAVVFGATTGLPLAYLLVPLSMWVALRFPTVLAAGHTLLVAVVVVGTTWAGRGPFGAIAPASRVGLAQAFVAVVALVSLVLALDRDERHALLDSLGSAQRGAAAQATLLDAVIRSISDGVVVAGPDGRLLLHNPAAGALLGLDVHPEREHDWPEAYGMLRPDGSLFPPSQLPLVRALAGEEVTDVDLLAPGPDDGKGTWFSVSARPLPGPPGAHGAVAAFHDVTTARLAQAALARQALHDPLTGLANRTLFTDRLQQALAAGERSGRPVGVLYLDLDGFKAVNDAAGHAAGDEVLVQTAERLTCAVRPGDTVARLGGDEFAVLCQEVAAPAVLDAVADRIQDVLSVPFALTVGAWQVCASIGRSLSDGGRSADQLLQSADLAMYAAKHAGRAPDRRERQQAGELRRGLAAGELVVHGQPVVDLASGRVVAVDARLRWLHPTRGVLQAPDLAAAEHGPLGIALCRQLLAEACRQAVGWAELLGLGPDLHVTVSGRQLAAGAAAEVLPALDRYGLPGSRLVLGLEGLLHVDEPLRADLEALRRRGARIALGGLGGDTGLVRVLDVPVDVLTVDARLVVGLGLDPGCDAVTKAILAVGSSLGLSVVAEGVQTPAQAELLRGFGCDTASGHLFSPPRPEADLVQHLRSSAAAARI